mmetsp:Transcript_45277/g.78325  ORF Transcript_45277/g.78325 Transcript_45277/m.78325 type:complete len:379 (+) Transcript_45277:1-1137(+)
MESKFLCIVFFTGVLLHNVVLSSASSKNSITFSECNSMKITSASSSSLFSKPSNLLAISRGGAVEKIGPEARVLLTQMMLSGSAGMLASVFSHPLDLTKTRLQLDGELAQRGEERVYKSWMDCFISNWKSNGIAGLEQGLQFAMMREFVVNLFRLGLYQPVLTLVRHLLPATSDGGTSTGLTTQFLVASIVSLCGGVFANPLDILKTRFQTHRGKSYSTGFQHEYTSTFGALQSLCKEDGIKGLLNGFGTSGLRIAVGGGVQLPAYFSMKALILSGGFQDGALVHAAASLWSSALVVLCINPMDVVRTRIYNQPYDAKGKGKWYSSGFDAAQKIARIEGLLAFYKGALTHYMRLGPHLMLAFVFNEQFLRIAKNFSLI